MSKHTKGPWTWDGSVCVNAPKVEGERQTDNLISLVYSCRPDDGTRDNLSANARLIAAAPDLLEALEQCEEYFDNRADADCDQDGYIPNKEMQLLTVVRDALRKAGAL